MTQPTPVITAYLKTSCGWSEGVRAVLRKYNLPYEEKDVVKNPAFRWEMETRSGQRMTPCLEINGNFLPDVSGEEVESWLDANGYIRKNDLPADAPTNSCCGTERHREMARANASKCNE